MLQRAAQIARSAFFLVLEFTVPYAVTEWYHLRYTRTTPFTDADLAAWRGQMAGIADEARRKTVTEAVAEIYESEKERQARLEDKLNGQANLLGAVYPIAAAIVALAVAGGNAVAIAVSAIGIVHLTLGFMAARFGISSSTRFEPQIEDVRAAIAGDADPSVALAALKAACVEANRPRAVRTNNWIWCCQVALVWAVVLTATAAILLLPAHLPNA